jgi:hypothetical protein
MYSDFWSIGDSRPVISASESSRFGRTVSRFNLGFDSKFTDDEIMSICSLDDSDLLVLRIPSTRIKIGCLLSRLQHKFAFQADTLVYYELNTPVYKALPNNDAEIFRLGSANSHLLDQFTSLIQQTFTDYTNHYGANQKLDMFNVEAGYLEWTLGFLADPSCNTFVRCTNPKYIDGWMTVKENGDYVEMIIGGSNPLSRGTGTYMKLVNAIVLYYLNFGTKYVRVSTQITNTDVIGVWQKNGFKFLGSINTFHIEKT